MVDFIWDINSKEAEANSSRDDDVNPRKDDNFIDYEGNTVVTFNLQNYVENKRVEPVVALESVASMKGIYLKEHSSETEFITFSVNEVLKRVSLWEGENPSLFPSTERGKSTGLPIGTGEKHKTYQNKQHLFGMEHHMEQLEKKLEFDCDKTRIIGVVGMPGIGKTTLAVMLHQKWNSQFIRCVPLLNIQAFQLFNYHVFDDKIRSSTNTFLTLSRKFVDYARGHPLALNLLGRELRGKDRDHWEHKLATLTSSNMMFQDVWRFSTDQLNERQKDVFLDIACFFNSEDEYIVRSLLDSGDPDSIDTVSEVRDLANKFLITISDSRIIMNDMMYTFGKDLGSPRWLRLWNYEDFINKSKTMEKSCIFFPLLRKSTDIPTKNEILGISRGISEEIPRKHKIGFPRKKTDEFRGNIIAVGAVGDFTKFRGNSDELAFSVGIPSEFPRSVGRI
ncbi:hypothetical protein F2Q68_00010793 [Brassica cretica]|uniref:NB-ARC domain-containing protein n=1 Tax=Brassica cretica TaxID=69181 RepID=A0A8S9KK01_BRACR|nr:hypothetical protein F2Q68_00010793 [Brassica cretica]